MKFKFIVFFLSLNVFAIECEDVKWLSFRSVDVGIIENSLYQGSYKQQGSLSWGEVEEAVGLQYKPIQNPKKKQVIEKLFSECRPDYIEISLADLGKKTLSSVVTEQIANILKSKNECSSGDSASNCINKKKSFVDSNKFSQFKWSRGSNLSFISTEEPSSCTNSPDNPDEGEMTQEKCELDPNRYWYGDGICYYKEVEVPEPEHEIIVLGKSPYWTEYNPFMITNTKTYMFKFCPINGLIFRGFYSESTTHQFTQNGNIYQSGEGNSPYDVHYDSYLQSFNNFCPL